MAAKKKAAQKAKKKQWYPIHAPKLFNETLLGETVVFEKDQMVGKRITQNLMNLTGDIKRQSINLQFEIEEVRDDKAHTKIIGYRMISASIKRMVRRRNDKIELSFICETSDNIRVRLKPIIITRSYAPGVVLNKLRRQVKDNILREVKKLSFLELLNELITHKMQGELKAKLSKTHPIKICEIKSMELERVTEGEEPTPVAETDAEEEPPKAEASQ